MKVRTCLAAALVFTLPSVALAADPVAGLGTALNLESSTSDGVEVADDAAFDIGTGSFTIEAWTKRSSVTGGFYTIAAKQQNAGWYFRLNGSTLNFTTAFDSSSGNSVSAASDITDTNWHHVVGVHDASAKTLSIYIDGVLSNSLTYSSAANVDNTYALGIGFKPGWGEYFDGSLDEIRFWNTARTAAQIREYMNTPLAGNEAGLVGYWNLEEGSGTSLANRSGTSGLGGTLKNPDSNEWITGNISYSATTNEDVNVSLRLGGSDADSQSSATAVITDLPDHGALYQTNDGSTSVTQISAISTALTDTGGNPRRVIFVPTANYNGSDSFSYKVNDGTTDSANTVTVNLSIAAVADAPTATNLTQSKSATEGGGAIALDDIVVTDGDSGDTITATLTLSSTSAGSLSTGTYGSATSTFNAGTGVWTMTGSVSDVNAALAAVAFTPSANNDQNFTITTRIRDAASAGPADGTISVTVTGTNDAPLFNTTPVLRFTANEDAGAPVNGVASGTLVSAFTGGITDVDTGASKGIAIVFADATNGTWWYSVDAGTTWSTLGTPSAGAARLLASDARLHFEPTADWNGTVTPGLTIRAWDASTGTNGDTGNITSTGGSTAYSVASDTVVLAVDAVNDAPTATNLTQSKAATEAGSTVALDDIVVTDGDSGDTITATLTLSSTSAGSLSTGTYGSATSTFNAGTGVWTVTGSVSDVNAALAAVAFTPSANNDQNFTITTQIRDAVDSGPANGTISFTVTAVNDNPAATGLPASLSYSEDTQGNFDVSASEFSDVDSTNVTVVFTASAGTFGLAASGGISLSTLSGNGMGTITIAGTIANVNQYLDIASNVTFTPAANASGSPAATVTVTANDGNGSGNVTAGTIDINVTSVNDAPTLTATGLDPTFGEGGSAVDLFGTVTASTVDSTQTFSALTLTVTNVSNGTAEILAIGGTDVALTNGNSGTLTGIGTFSVSVASGTATVSVSGMTRDNTQMNTLVDGITYRNTATPPGTTARVVTLTNIQDSGGTANGGVDSTTISLASTVTIDLAPTVSSSNRNSPSGSATNAASVVYRVTFSEVVTGVGTADFTLTMTGTANGSIASVSAVSGTVYDVTVNTISGDGTLRLDLKNAGTGIADAATNAIATGYTSGQTYSIDSTASSVTSVSVPANATYVAGQNLDFTVNWGENVTVDTTGGTPTLALTVGSTARTATYQSGSGSSALVFRHTVQSGDLDVDGITVGALALNSGTLKDGAGNNATLTLNSVGSTASVKVDANAPTVNSRTVPADGTYKTGQQLDFTVTYSENVTVGAGTPYIALTLATGGSVQAAYNGGTGTSTLTFRYTVATGNLDADGITVADAITLNGGTVKDDSGNDAAISSLGFGSTAAVLVDAVAPTVSTIARQTPSSATTNATSVVYRVTFAESVTGVDTADFTLTTTDTAAGTIAAISGSGATYDVTVNAISGDGTLRLDLNGSGTGIADSATNAIGTSGFTSGQVYTLDTRAPSVSTIDRRTPATVHTDAASTTWRVTFSEGVTGVDTADFALTSVTGTGTGTIASVSAVSTAVYEVVVNSITGHRTLRLDLNASGTGITDTAGNAVSTGYTGGEFYITGLTSELEAPTIRTGSVVYGVSKSAGTKVAQRFTTDATSATTLKSIAARIVTLSTPTPVVTINANNAGAPGAVVGTLTNPASLTAGTLNVWTGNVQLAASTTYWVVFAADAGSYDIARASAASGGTGAWLGVSDYAVLHGANLASSANDVVKIALGATSVPAITSTLTASGTVGSAFTYTITASNSPSSYAATGLPAGLSLDTATGAITGTPTAAGTVNVVLTATNGSGTGASATLVLSVRVPDAQPNPFNPGGTQTETSLEPDTGITPVRAPNDIVTNLNNLDNRVGISDNGVVVVLDNGLKEPVKFRDDPPDNVLISMPSQKPLDVQLNGNTLNIHVDPETPNPPKQTILGTTTLLLPDGSQSKGLQLVQGEVAIGNQQPGGVIGGMELSKDTTLRSVVAQSGALGGTAGFRKSLDGSGSVSAESGDVIVRVRLKSSSVSTLTQAMTLPGFATTSARPATDATVTLTLKAGEVARFDALGQLDGVYLGSLSGNAGKTGDTLAMTIPAGVAAYPASTLVFDGDNVPARLGMPFSDFLNAQLADQLHFVQRGDGLMEVTSPAGGKFYARTFGHFEVLPDAADGPSANGDGSLSLTYGGIRSTWRPMLEDAADFAAYFAALGGYVTDVLENGNVQLSGATTHFFVARPRHALRKVFDATQGIAPIAPGDSSLFYTNARGEQQQLDPAFHDEAQLRSAAAAQGWTLARSGLGGNNLTVTSPAGVVYQVVPDLRVDVLGADNGLSGVIRQEGGKLYFYYEDEPLRQGFMLK